MRFENEIILDPKLLGWRIRQAREQLRLSQEELAALVSKDQRAVSEYENGRRKLPVTDLPLFAHVLKVPITYFFEGESITHELDDAMLSHFHRFPTAEARQAVVEIMRIMADTFQPHEES